MINQNRIKQEHKIAILTGWINCVQMGIWHCPDGLSKGIQLFGSGVESAWLAHMFHSWAAQALLFGNYVLHHEAGFKRLNRILHNVAWISLFSVKDHVFLMNLTMPVMSFDHSRVYDDGVVCASCIGSDWRPPFFIPGFCSKRSITECHTGDYQCPLNLTTTAIVMHLTGILMALACSTCKVYPATIHGTLTGAIVKAILDDWVSISPRGAMQENFLVKVSCQCLSAVENCLGVGHHLPVAIQINGSRSDRNVVDGMILSHCCKPGLVSVPKPKILDAVHRLNACRAHPRTWRGNILCMACSL